MSRRKQPEVANQNHDPREQTDTPALEAQAVQSAAAPEEKKDQENDEAKHDTVPRQNMLGVGTDPRDRRFESISWLIQGDSKVGAACFDGEDLLLGSNTITAKNTEKGEVLLQDYEIVQAMKRHEKRAKLIVQHLKMVAEKGAELASKQNQEDIDEIYKQSNKEIRDQTKLLLKSELTRLRKSTEPDAVEEEYKRFVRALYKVTDSILTSYLAPLDARALPRKFCDALKDNKVKYLFSEGELEKVHAEQQVLQYLLYSQKLQSGGQYYIGISRRCCLLCEHLIKAVDQAVGGHIYDSVLVRDIGHGNRYPTKIPPFLSNKSALPDLMRQNIIKNFKINLTHTVRTKLDALDKKISREKRQQILTRLQSKRTLYIELNKLLSNPGTSIEEIFSSAISPALLKEIHTRSPSPSSRPGVEVPPMHMFRVSDTWRVYNNVRVATEMQARAEAAKEVAQNKLNALGVDREQKAIMAEKAQTAVNKIKRPKGNKGLSDYKDKFATANRVHAQAQEALHTINEQFTNAKRELEDAAILN